MVSYRLKPSKIGDESLSKPLRFRNLVHCSTELKTNLKPAEIRGDFSSQVIVGCRHYKNIIKLATYQSRGDDVK